MGYHGVMKRFALMGALALTMAAFADKAPLVKKGDVAPAFKTASTDGQKELKSLLKQGPVFLVFLKDHCSANPFAVKYYTRLSQAYGKATQFFVVINTDKKGHDEWKKEWGNTQVALLDPNSKIIDAYGIQHSTIGVEIGKDGKVVQVFPGYGIESLKQFNTRLAAAAKTKPKSIDFAEAPTNQAFG